MKRTALILLALLLVPVVAGAASFTINISPTTGRNVTNIGVTNGTVTHAAGSIYVGQDTIKDATGQVLFPIAYCVDLNEWAKNPSTAHLDLLSTLPETQWDDPPGVNDGAGARIAWLLNTYAFGINDANHAAGLQLAIWEVEYERSGTLNVENDITTTSDNFYAWGNATAIGYANFYLETLGSNTSEGIWVDVESSNQDFGVPVPEPASMLLLGTGLLGLARASRKRRNRG